MKTNLFRLLPFLVLFLISALEAEAQFTHLSAVKLLDATGSSAWGDYDNDGDLDLVVSGSNSTKIYRNSGSSTFPDSIVLMGFYYTAVSWADYNNDGYLDLAVSGVNYDAGYNKYTKLYKNNGNNTFTEQASIGFSGVESGSHAWGDYDNDGDLDFLLTGYDITGMGITKIYRNNGNNSFLEQSGISIPGVSNGAGLWGDMDNDGFLDVVLIGSPSNIYKNNGDNSFTQVKDFYYYYWSGSGSLGDYDNDGDLDIAISGNDQGGIIRNNGNNTYEKLSSPNFLSAQYGSTSWGDYDNDGDLDVLLCGYDGSWTPGTRLYINNGNNNFSETASGLPNLADGEIKWADYDKDNDLDVILTGYNGSVSLTRIYRNDVTGKNTAPPAPTLPVSTVNNNNVTLSWKEVTTDATPANAISYNVRIGTVAGQQQILSPHSSSAGFRRIVEMGNGQLGTSMTLKALKKGTYYWSVQAVDNSFAGSAFTTEGSFAITTDLQASNIQLLKATGNSLLIQWSRGTGSKCAVFARAGNQGNALPVNSTTYTGNTTFGSGTQIGTSGWYCIYNGTADTITLRNLTPATDYNIQVIEYTGAAGSEVYNKSLAPSNPSVLKTSLFTELTSAQLTSVTGDMIWGDYDNDNDLDILLIGNGVTKIYRNDGSGVFTEQVSISLAGGGWGASAAWGDYDNDGDLDIVLNTDDPATKIYKNNGNNTFTEQVSIAIVGVRYSTFVWGDYDNDGDLDLYVGGRDASNNLISKVYRNSGVNGFLEQSGINLPGLEYPSFEWGDYDNDGDLDILISGYNSVPQVFKNNGNNSFSELANLNFSNGYGNGSAWGDYDNDGDLDIMHLGGYPAKLYRNDGGDKFIEQTGIVFPEFHYGTPVFGDYDNDGDLDLLLSGYDNTNNKVTKLYSNNGDNSFTEQTTVNFPGVSEGSSSWGDYDKDGDLDLLLNGYSNSASISKLFRNDIVLKNTAPAAPSNLVSVVNGNDVILKWNRVTGDATSPASMSYNVRLGSSTNTQNIVPSQSNITNGFRRVPRIGNAQLDTTFVLKTLKKGTYYWSVQAVDNGFAGSAFATEKSFTITTDAQASNIQLQKATGGTMLLQWSRGTGTQCIVFVKQSNAGNALPTNSITYTANPNFGSGTQIGATGWFCVAKGTSDTITVKGLQPLKDYRIQVFEFTGNAGSEVYFSSTGVDNPVTKQTTLLSEISGISIVSEARKAALGDYDKDGDLDILMGNRLYRNDGAFNFVEQGGLNFKNLGWSSGGSWNDYDNDGDLDALIYGEYYDGSWKVGAFLYRNDGGNVFTEQTSISMKGGRYGSVAWGDFDNDGDKDVILTGSDETWRPFTKFYRNNKGVSFTEITDHIFPAVYYSSVAWGDYNNDGYLDLAITGYSDKGYVTKLFKNLAGNSFVEEANASFTAFGSSALAWGDYDSDGDLDLLISGESPNGRLTELYRNFGNGNFTKQTTVVLPGASNPSLNWMDFDNDGDLDIFISGYDNSYKQFSKLFKNNGDNTFSEMANVTITAFAEGNSLWADLDNDQDLDLFLTGNSTSSWATKIYRNDIVSPKNINPTVLTGLSSSVNQTQVTLKWNPLKTDETPYKAMTYNVRVGTTTPNGQNILSANSNLSNGYRWIPAMGNAQLDTSLILNVIQKGTYYWSVQAVDNGLAGGPFAAEQTFSITANVQASHVMPQVGNAYAITLQWTRGNGSACVVFARKGNSGLAAPVNNTTYSANATFGNGTQIGSSGWFCVYKGTLDSVTVYNLSGDTEYAFQVIEYEGGAGAESYYITSGLGNPLYTRTDLYALKSVPAFAQLWKSKSALVDYDGDSDLDVFLMGRDDANSPVTKLYKNNGNLSFSEHAGVVPVSLADGSVAWGDYNNDGFPDVIISGKNASNTIYTKLYRNNAGISFSEQSGTVFPAVYNSAFAWGDYDNDGDLDLLLTGMDNSSTPVSKVFQNKGSGNFMEQVGIILPGIHNSSVAWGDYDNDADLDILISGNDGSTNISKIYRNNGNNTFSDQLGIALPGISNGNVIWGDYNEDSFQDIIVAGQDQYSNFITKIFRNNKDNTFTLMNEFKMDGGSNSGIAFADYDNDGDPDLVVCGFDNYNRFTKIYRNQADTAFVYQPTTRFAGIDQGAIQWADLDNDRDLEILLTGYNGTNAVSQLYINESKIPNTLPVAPSTLTSSVEENQVVLRWTAVSTDETSTRGMGYNLRIGRIPGASDVVSPHSATNGYRRIPVPGNAITDTSFVLKNLPRGPYYWNVQAIDNSLSGGAFSNQQQFLVTGFTQASNVQFLTSVGNSLLLQWSRGNGQKCVVFAKESTEGTASPEANTTYSANARFGKGSQIGTSGWYCVYNGDKDTVTVKDLKPSASYIFQVFEYEGSTGIEFYFPGSGQGNPAAKKVSLLSEQANFAVSTVYGGLWGDYDNDGDLDILSIGYPASKIYRNEGNNSFVEQAGITIKGVRYSSGAWGDYNNDGYLDFIITGYYFTPGIGYSGISLIYKNNGNNTFTEQSSISLLGVYYGAVAWGDYDNDGDLDLAITGRDYNGTYHARLYRNNGNNSFTEVPGLNLKPVVYSAVLWMDYNNDGLLDLLIGGNNSTTLYENKGFDSFEEVPSSGLPPFSYCSFDAGDYDNDGDLDILASGRSVMNNKSLAITTIFRNGGGGVFLEQSSIQLPAVYYSSVAWADYDNDGDLDIVVGGRQMDNTFLTKIYQNAGNNVFMERSEIPLPGIYLGTLRWGDYDSDGDLDLLISGSSQTGSISRIFRNNSAIKNLPPSTPTGLTGEIVPEGYRIRWRPVSNDSTNFRAITYNIRLGTTAGGFDKMPPHAAANGYPRLATIGNAQLDTFHLFTNLKKATYYWSVQAVDNGFMRSGFGPEQSFIINTDQQASHVKMVKTSARQLLVKWSRGNGDKCVVFAKKANSGTAAPVNNQTYTGSSSFGTGTQIGSTGWYCIYNGVSDTITISNLESLATYMVQVFEYNGTAGNEIYLANQGTANPGMVSTSQFFEENNIAFENMRYSDLAWGDYDNDGDLDLLLSGYSSLNKPITKVYRNNGDKSFTEQSGIVLEGVYYPSTSWVDYDNDGDLDISLSGYNQNTTLSVIYRNNGDNTFTYQSNINLKGVREGNLAWGDYDNDGDKDVFISGSENSGNPVSRLYRNNGDNTFAEQGGIGFFQITGYSTWADFDRDGYLDLIVSGNSTAEYMTRIYHNNKDNSFTIVNDLPFASIGGKTLCFDYDQDGDLDVLISGNSFQIGTAVTRLYRNDGNNTFVWIEDASFEGLNVPVMSTADADGDGDLDVLLMGTNPSGTYISFVYWNNGNGGFVRSFSGEFVGVRYGSAGWGDYDNDRDLDVIVTGQSQSGLYTRIYTNDKNLPNLPPSTPGNPAASVNGNEVIFHWNKSLSDETSPKGITYNLRIGKKSGGVETVSPHASGAGFLRVPSPGNIQLDTSYTLKELKKGIYYWAVQSVDNGFGSSAFSSEQSFSISSDFQASEISILSQTSTTMELQWKRGTGDACLVFMKKGNSGTLSLSPNTTYTPNPSFGLGSQVGSSGWYCVYKGQRSNCFVENLQPLTEYIISVVEFNGAAGAENYLSQLGNNNPVVITSGEFSEIKGQPLMGVQNGNVSLADYNNDGFLDVLLSGNDTTYSPFTKLYRNTGGGNFVAQNNISFENIDRSSSGWADYDKDNDLDLLISGYSYNSSNRVTKLYRNNGDNTFTEQQDVTFPGLYYGSLAWGDYDNDGDPDIVISGRNQNNQPYTRIFRNDQKNIFTEQSGILITGVYYSNVSWTDYDNDNDLDLFICGQALAGPVTKIYRNEGQNNFVEQVNIVLQAVYYGSSSWGDYDNDGWLDLLLTGYGGNTGLFSKVYKNNGNNSFTEQTDIVLLPSAFGTSSWGDFDNDGKLDILTSGNGVTKLYRNNGNGTFSEKKTVILPGLDMASASWGDLDSDGDLDMVLTGVSGNDLSSTYLFRNDRPLTSTKPNAPQGLNVSLFGNQVTFKWNSVKGNETPAPGMSYNLRLSKSSGGTDVMPSNSSTNGYRRLVGKGNSEIDTTALLYLPKGTYYWQVQAVNHAFVGGSFSAEDTFTVSKLTPVIDWENPDDIEVGIALSDDQLDAASNVPGTLTYDPGPGTLLNGGNEQELKVTFVPADTGSYVNAAKSAFINVKKLDQTIAFGDLPQKVFGAGDFNPGAVATSSLQVSYTSSNPNVATIVNGKIHLTGIGETSITASQVGNYKFNPALEVSQTLMVLKASQAITFPALSNVAYRSPDLNPASASSGLQISYQSSDTNVAKIINGKIRPVGVGSAIITASQNGNDFYFAATPMQQTLNVVKSNQSISFGAIGTKSFGDTDFAPGATASSGLPVVMFVADTNIAIIRGGLVHIKGTGNTWIVAKQPGNNFYLPADSAKQELKVIKGNQTLIFPVMQPRTFGETDFDPGATTTSGLPIVYSSSNPVVASIVNGKVHILSAWITEITATQPGNSNYNPATSITRTLIVNKASQEITFPALPDRGLGAGDYNPGATSSSGLPVSYLSTNPSVAMIVSNKIRVLSIGTTDIIASQPGNANYSAAPDVVQTLRVNATDMTDLNSFGIRMYPVPAKDYVYIESENQLKMVELIDMIGKSIRVMEITNRKTPIDVSDLPKGVYLIRFTGDDFRTQTKLMVE